VTDPTVTDPTVTEPGVTEPAVIPEAPRRADRSGPPFADAPRRGRRRKWVVAVVAVVLLAGVGVGLSRLFTAGGSTAGVSNNSHSTSLASVTRRDLSSQTELSATLGYAGSYTVLYQSVATSGTGGAGSGGSSATFTYLPAVGQVVDQGQTLYDVNGIPVLLLYGPTPAYRSLSEGATGADVAELNADLVALGYVTTSEIPADSDEFSYWTEVGVNKLQAVIGATQTGTLALGQAVFVPTAARVTSLTAILGGPAQSGTPVLDATSTSPQVSIDLDATQESEVKVGDKVTITLPNNQTTPGMIASVGTVATTPSSSSSSDSSASSSASTTPTITVLVTPTDPAATGSWDQASVNVTITTGSVANALVVPVDALLALSGGGYAVEVVNTAGVHSLVPVTLGLFDDADGLVQVTSSKLADGQRVVVPAT